MNSASNSRLSKTPFPVRKLREMSAGFRSFVNLEGEERGGSVVTLNITIDTVCSLIHRHYVMYVPGEDLLYSSTLT